MIPEPARPILGPRRAVTTGKRNTPARRIPKPQPVRAEVGVIVLDLALRPIAFDWGAAEMLTEAARRRGDSPLSMPRELLDAIRRPKPGVPSEKIPFRLGTRDFSCRAYLLESANPSQSGPMLAVHLERGLSVQDAVTQAGSEYGLTDRENEVLQEIASGLTSKEVAERMNISPNTVKAFLRMIMMKMGVSTRSGVIAKLLEHSETQ